MLLETVFGVMMIFGLLIGPPIWLLWIVRSIWKSWAVGTRQDRRVDGLCVYCAYECVGLHSPTCPECGKPHMSRNQTPHRTKA